MGCAGVVSWNDTLYVLQGNHYVVCQIYTVTQVCFFHSSGVILERAPAHGPVVMVSHVMIMTHAHVETRV